MKSRNAQPNRRSTKPATKPLIAVDFDDVLFLHYELLAEYFLKTYKLDLNLITLQRDMMPQLQRHTDLSREKIVHDVERFLLSPDHQPKPLPDAAVVISRLKPHYRLAIVTARADFIREQTIEWAQTHYPSFFDDVVFARMLRWGDGPKVIKTELLQDMGADILIDDSPRHCIQAAEMGVRAILFGDAPWNKVNSLPEKVVRAKNWREVEAILL